MAKQSIPTEIKQAALRSVVDFNKENKSAYSLTFRGKHAYLARNDGFAITKIGRLTYLPEEDKWAFAVYKYSREAYDPEEWMFPGTELLDGTIEGAMKAGFEIYPE
jgi:hypothetical protein